MSFSSALQKCLTSHTKSTNLQKLIRRYNSNYETPPGCDEKVIDCHKIVGEINKQVKYKIEDRLFRGGHPPRLSMIVFWQETEARRFAKKLLKNCDHVGIETSIHKMSPSMSSTDLHDILVNVGYDSHTDAGLIVLPLMKDVQLNHVHIGLDLQKDIDGFGVSYRKFMWGNQSYVPAKVSATLEVLRRRSVKTALKTTLLHGKTRNLKVMKSLILQSNIRNTGLKESTAVVETDADTPKSTLKNLALKADIIMSEVGLAKSITADMVKPGCHVIDLSQNRVVDGNGNKQIVGDVDIDEVKHVAAGVTPVPGGIGPLSIAMICKHTLLASKFPKEKNSYF